jgi:hypothetical protein
MDAMIAAVSIRPPIVIVLVFQSWFWRKQKGLQRAAVDGGSRLNQLLKLSVESIAIVA